ncbi:MAG: DASS family sodium-coupled anion symporter [Gammaproteobacteria bacterium]|nr:DASS family sodium-coupled anion symporter [Gammaproteobacteria bacterium]
MDHRRSLYAIIIASIFYFGCTHLVQIPQGVDQVGWNAFFIFVITIALVIFKVYEMGVVSFLAMSALIATSTITVDQALLKFSYPITWLVVFAFFISKAFILSGLGKRIALWMSAVLGSTPLRLTYALMLAECIIAPFIPSNTARGGGLIVPVAQALGEGIFGTPSEKDRNFRHWNAFILYGCFQANLISSALFLTAMAGNPMIANIAAEVGYQISWLDWFSGAIVPSIIALIVTPLFLQKIVKPDHDRILELGQKTQDAYLVLGPMRAKEMIMGMVFLFLLTAWVIGPLFGIQATAAALFAITILLITEVLSWHELVTDHHAWTTFIWLTVLFTLTALMKDHGFIDWAAQSLMSYLPQLSPKAMLCCLMCINFYVHYFFASLTSHITTIFHPLVLIGLGLNVPVKPLIYGLAFSTSLSGGLTHYGTGAGTITYGMGYWTLRDWWVLGLLQGTLLLLIFMITGLVIWF